MFIVASQSSDPLASDHVKVIPILSSASVQTEDSIDPDVYERLFLAMNQPVFAVNLSSSHEKSESFLQNSAATALIESARNDFFQESHLEKFNASLANFIRSIKSKVSQEVSYADVFHVTVNVNSKPCEIVFAFTATTFELKDGKRILSILLMETSRISEEEIRTVESFKASLVSALSHELNNPMNSLIPLIRMMPNTVTDNGDDDLKSMALSSAYILKNKIHDLIDYASIETKSMKLEQTEFFVEDLFDELKKVFKVEAERKQNTLKFSIMTYANRKLKIFADRNRLEQILIKLITNANKYTDRGTIQVAAEENHSDFDITFTVKDTGVGISKDRVNLIFAPLNHKHRQSDEYAKLPGLGLEIAKGICQCMDSKLNVKSVLGKGTKFSFEVPTCRISIFETPDCPQDSKEELRVIEPNISLSNDADFNAQLDNLRDSKAIRSNLYNREDNIRLTSKKDFMLNSKFSTFIDDKAVGSFDDISERISQYNGYKKKSCDSVFRFQKISNNFKAKQRLILITDDAYSNRLVLRKMLEHFKIESMEAINGQEAVNAVEKSFSADSSFEISLILMDLHMPIMNGIDATIKIRKLERKHEKRKIIPIVAVTAHDGAKDKKACFNAGMQEYIVKPATCAILKKIVTQYMVK